LEGWRRIQKIGYSKRLKDIYLIVRLDGKDFHRLPSIYGFRQPFDKNFHSLMVKTAKSLFRKLEFKPLFSYTFSDEINLLFYKSPSDRKLGYIIRLLPSYTSSLLQSYLSSLRSSENSLVDFLIQVFKTRFSEDVLEYFSCRCSSCLNNFIKKYVSGFPYGQKGFNLRVFPKWEKYGTVIYRRIRKKERLLQKSINLADENGRKWLSRYLKMWRKL